LRDFRGHGRAAGYLQLKESELEQVLKCVLMQNTYSSNAADICGDRIMSTFPWDIVCLCVAFLVGSVVAADIPFVFDNNFSSIINCTPSQLEDISKHAPEVACIPPIHTSSTNKTIINISGINKNSTNYMLPPDYSIGVGPADGIGEDWFKYGNINYDEGNYNKSIECYEKATQENPWFADAWYNKGTALCKLGRYEDAVKAFDKALEINPNYAKARENRDAAYRAIRK
jgi:hypothetical protein